MIFDQDITKDLLFRGRLLFSKDNQCFTTLAMLSHIGIARTATGSS